VIRCSDRLWPVVLAWTLTRETAVVVSGENRYLEAELRRLATDDEMGRWVAWLRRRSRRNSNHRC